MKFLSLQQTPCPGSGSALKVCLRYLRRRLIYKSAEDEMNREAQTPQHRPGGSQWPGWLAPCPSTVPELCAVSLPCPWGCASEPLPSPGR